MIPVLDLSDPVPNVHVQPPMVYVEPVWEYKHLARRLTQENPPSDAELNRLGAEGWELVGIVSDSQAVHFYFKRLAR
jgi:hypothetical protein